MEDGFTVAQRPGHYVRGLSKSREEKHLIGVKKKETYKISRGGKKKKTECF